MSSKLRFKLIQFRQRGRFWNKGD